MRTEDESQDIMELIEARSERLLSESYASRVSRIYRQIESIGDNYDNIRHCGQ